MSENETNASQTKTQGNTQTASNVSEKTTKSVNNSNSKPQVIIAHLLGGFFGFLPPLIILLISDSELVKKHAKESLNWQISLIIYVIIFTTISTILNFITLGLFGIIATLVYLAISIVSIIFSIMATVKANINLDQIWKYPLTIRFLK